jgi:RNA polymerase-binding transcription factor DksA
MNVPPISSAQANDASLVAAWHRRYRQVCECNPLRLETRDYRLFCSACGCPIISRRREAIDA